MPAVLQELRAEAHRRGDECYRKDRRSQETACFLLGLRGVSLLLGMGELQRETTFDSWEVLCRALLEARDLLVEFRFLDTSRARLDAWFGDSDKRAWQADYKKVQAFYLEKTGETGGLAKRWGIYSTLAHPTHLACGNSCASINRALGVPADGERYTAKAHDYLAAIGNLASAITVDTPELLPLGCDHGRMPNVRTFSINTYALLSENGHFAKSIPARPMF